MEYLRYWTPNWARPFVPERNPQRRQRKESGLLEMSPEQKTHGLWLDRRHAVVAHGQACLEPLLGAFCTVIPVVPSQSADASRYPSRTPFEYFGIPRSGGFSDTICKHSCQRSLEERLWRSHLSCVPAQAEEGGLDKDMRLLTDRAEHQTNAITD